MIHLDKIDSLDLQMSTKKEAEKLFNFLKEVNMVIKPLLKKLLQSSFEDRTIAAAQNFLLFGFTPNETCLKNAGMAV